MDKKEILRIVDSAYLELKDFQCTTVEYVFNKLYRENYNKHLVADEVGLGKTIVAKGIIAKAMERHINSSRKNKPFKVIYICSNQALTGQNLKKLNIFNKKEFIDVDKGRLIFQAFKPNDNEIFQLSSLTPSTSFRLIKGTGIAEERKLIWLILSQYKVYYGGRRRNGLKLALLGNVTYVEWWKNNLDKYAEDKLKDLRPDIFRKFKNSVRATNINLSCSYYSAIRKETGLSGEVSLQKLLLWYSDILRVDTVKNYSGPIRLLGQLRKLLTEVCLDYLNADLYILDEFQRFKDLIATEGEKISEAAAIAKKVFSVKGSKVLMLSATPFKSFTTSIDAEFNENHFKEFSAVLSFLLNHDKEQLVIFDQNRKTFFEILRRPETLDQHSNKSKLLLEHLYRKVISRTERLLVSDDKNTLLKNKIENPLELVIDDVDDFIKTDKIIQILDIITKKGSRNIVDYCKSVPFPLSFLDGYQIKDDLKRNRSDKQILKVIKANLLGWLDMSKVHLY